MIKQQFPLATLDMVINRIKVNGTSVYFSMLNELPNEKFYIINFAETELHKSLFQVDKELLIEALSKFPSFPTDPMISYKGVTEYELLSKLLIEEVITNFTKKNNVSYEAVVALKLDLFISNVLTSYPDLLNVILEGVILSTSGLFIYKNDSKLEVINANFVRLGSLLAQHKCLYSLEKYKYPNVNEAVREKFKAVGKLSDFIENIILNEPTLCESLFHLEYDSLLNKFIDPFNVVFLFATTKINQLYKM